MIAATVQAKTCAQPTSIKMLKSSMYLRGDSKDGQMRALLKHFEEASVTEQRIQIMRFELIHRPARVKEE
jgi:hypothetical protein